VELRQLVYFARVAELGNFTRAAQTLHLVQPALSQQVAALERELGLPLFHRGARGVRLTEAGERLLPYVRRVLGELERAQQAVGELRELRTGRVALGLTPSATLSLLPAILETYRARHPAVEVQIVEEMTDALVEQLLDGRLDLALVSFPVEDPRLEMQPLVSERLALVVPPDHRLAAAETVDLAELAGEPWILPYRRHGTRALVEAACQQAGFSLRVAVELSGLGPIKQLVQRGVGLSILPPAIVENESKLGLLRTVQIAHPPLVRTLGLARRRGEHPTPAAAAMVRIIESLRP
jgi:DNA-binding transcriptional LysR family regulator